MRRAARIDKGQPLIVAALRRIGAKVKHTHMVGDDFPDLVVGFRKRNILLEVKSKGRKETEGQSEFASSWPGEVYTVWTPEEAVAVVIGKEAMA